MSSSATTTIDVRISGMHCATCAQTIQRSLRKLDGVADADVNFGTGSARVTYDPAAVGTAGIEKAVADAGFTVVHDVEQDRIEQERDLRGKQWRFVTGFIAAGVIMALMYLRPTLPFPLGFLLLGLSLPPFVYVSLPIFRAAGVSLSNLALSMDVMYALGIGVAFVSSICGTIGIMGAEFVFYETALMLASFLMLGRFLEARARGRTSDAIRKLVGIQPKTAVVVREAAEETVAVDKLAPGDIVIVKPGERIPVDGTVAKGQSYVDESMITGEPVAALRSPGQRVIGGTINTNSVLRVKVDKFGADTVLAHIVRLVTEAQASRPPTQRVADRVVAWFIPAVLGIALAAFVIWHFVLGSTLLFAVSTFIAVVVIACPCALGLASPTAVMVGIGRGAQLGILIRNGTALEVAPRITTVMIDKTGTLTRGMPEVTDIAPLGMSDNELLALAAGVEKDSQHPLAGAIVKAAAHRGVALPTVTAFETIGGKGVSARVGGSAVLIGTRRLLDEQGVAVAGEAAVRIGELERQGKTVVLAARDGVLAGAIAIADTVKPDSLAAVAALHRMGMTVVMVTGDTRATADAVASQLGIERVVAGALPDEKAEGIAALQKTGETVAFVGDGINDAPALARADVGIAMGGGTDIAIESGDIVLVNNSLIDAVAAIQLSRKVMGRIRQNLFWAFAYNAALIPAAAGLLHPLLGITFRPELGGLAMALSSVTVMTLSLMLRNYTPPVRSGYR